MKDTLEKIEPGIWATDSAGEGAPYDKKARMYEFLVGTWSYNKIAWGTRPQDYRDFAAMVMHQLLCNGSNRVTPRPPKL
jgi:hypothetical protein